MKRFITILSMCLLLFATSVPSAQANKGKAAKKVIELISKGAKKTPKKAAPIRKAPARHTTPKPRPRPNTTVTCSQCNGRGTTTYWNSYAGQYQTVRCSKCDGKGKVRR